MKFGICCGPASFAPQVQGQALAGVPRMMEVLADAGADYVEFGVGAVSPEADESVFDALREALRPFPLRVEAFNSFIPAKHRFVGPDVNLPAVLDYCRAALRRCHALGGEVVVLGSAGARRIPHGFERARAEEQFLVFARALGPLAADAGLDIAVEPLNKKEDNFCNSVQYGARLVELVAHSRIRLLADLYHIAQEKEPLPNVASAGALLCHTHVADLGRVAPGFAPSGEEDFTGFFRALRAARYDRRCSFEGAFENIETQAKPVIALLKKRWAATAGQGPVARTIHRRGTADASFLTYLKLFWPTRSLFSALFAVNQVVPPADALQSKSSDESRLRNSPNAAWLRASMAARFWCALRISRRRSSGDIARPGRMVVSRSPSS